MPSRACAVAALVALALVATAASHAVGAFNHVEMIKSSVLSHPVVAQHMRVVRTVSAQLQRLRPQVESSGNLTTACNNTINHINDHTLFESCRTNAGEQLLQGGNMSSVCAECTTLMQGAAKNISSTCTSADFKNAGVYDRSAFANMFVNFACKKSGGAYCLSQFVESMQIVDQARNDENATFNKSVLNKVCSSCAMEASEAFVNNADLDTLQTVLATRTLCLKDGGEYCVLKMQELSKITDELDVGECVEDIESMIGPDFNPNNKAALKKLFKKIISCMIKMVNKVFETLCGNRCIKLLLNVRLAEIDYLIERRTEAGESTEELLAERNDVAQANKIPCMRDGSGRLCLSRVISAQFDSIDLDAVFEGEGEGDLDVSPCSSGYEDNNCTSACKTQIQSVHSSVGCCAQAYYAMNAQDAEASVDDFVDFLQGECEITPLDACKKAKISGRIVLSNLRKEYVQANEGTLSAGIARDLGVKLGVSPSDIEVEFVYDDPVASSVWLPMAASSSVSFDYSLSLEDSNQAKAIGKDIKTMVSSGNLNLNTISSVGADALEDPSKPAGVDSKASTIKVEGATSAAATLSSSAATVIATVIAAIAMLAGLQ